MLSSNFEISTSRTVELRFTIFHHGELYRMNSFFMPKYHLSNLTFSYLNPRHVWAFSRTRPAGGRGVRFCPLSSFRTNGRKKPKKRQTKALNKLNLRNTNNFALRGQRSGQGQVKGQNYRFPRCWLQSPTGAALIGALHPERVRRLVRRGTVLTTLRKGQGQGQVRSIKVICWTG